jgi:hypothetical protein
MMETPSFSISLRVCSTVFGGLKASSKLMRLILRPLIPPCSLIILKYASSALPTVPQAEAGPLYGIVWPILISVAVTPGALLFCAAAGEIVMATPQRDSKSIAKRSVVFISTSPE